MTKAAALYQFFSSFGLTAYEEDSVYAMAMQGQAPSYPYLTYEGITDYFGDQSDTPLSFSLWYRTSSWTEVNAKSQQISAAIGRVGTIITCDGGYILIKRSSPWAKNMGDDSDDMIRRNYHNLSVRFYTND